MNIDKEIDRLKYLAETIKIHINCDYKTLTATNLLYLSNKRKNIKSEIRNLYKLKLRRQKINKIINEKD